MEKLLLHIFEGRESQVFYTIAALCFITGLAALHDGLFIQGSAIFVPIGGGLLINAYLFTQWGQEIERSSIPSTE